jgi:hypothetical protein
MYEFVNKTVAFIKSKTCTKAGWTAARAKVGSLVELNACQDAIRPGYILRSNFGFDLVSQWGKEPGGEGYKRDIMMLASPIGSKVPVGFLLGCDEEFKAENAYYIDVVCAMNESGGGTPLISTFMEHFSDRNIKLSAITNVLTFYPKKFNFQFGKTCDEADRVSAQLGDVEENVTYEKLKSRNYSKFSRKSKEALAKLIRLKLDNGVSMGPECVNVDAKTFFKNGCEDGGFNMIKCNAGSEPLPKRRKTPRFTMTLRPRKNRMTLRSSQFK